MKFQILSHRGLWENEEEKNTKIAFHRSFCEGFGTETDVRDYCGELVISHDISNSECMKFEEFLILYSEYGNNLPLALNIKADGLQKKLFDKLEKYKVTNYFVFDMSIPDGVGYLKSKLKTFTRQSEYEVTPSFYEEAQGVWLDEFFNHWITDSIIHTHIENKKEICIVSPDLHRRPVEKEWEHYKQIAHSIQDTIKLMICTDKPKEAERVINEN